jgi:hypothetical protein
MSNCKSNDELKKYAKSITQNLPVAGISKAVDRMNRNLLCDEDCRRRKESERLWSIYLKKENNVKVSPPERDMAYQKYYIHTYGRDKYMEYRRNKANQEANILINEKLEDFNEKKNELYHFLNDVDKQKYSSEKVIELSKKYGKINIETEDNISRIKNNKNLSNRLTYYVDNEENTYENWNKFFNILFWILFVLYIGIIIIIGKKYRNKICIMTAVSFIIFYLILKFLLPNLVYYFFIFFKPIESEKINNYPNKTDPYEPRLEKLRYMMKDKYNDDESNKIKKDKEVIHGHIYSHEHENPKLTHYYK